MFRKRTEPPELSDKEKELLQAIAEGINTKFGIYERFNSWSITRRAIAKKIIGDDKGRLFVPEFMLVNHKKKWNELSLEEADYFAAKMLGLDVVLEPVVEGLLESPVVCVNRNTGSWVCPTADWSYAEKLQQHRLLTWNGDYKNEYIVCSPTHEYRHKKLCTAIVYAALARDEPYVIDYTDATTRNGP